MPPRPSLADRCVTGNRGACAPLASLPGFSDKLVSMAVHTMRVRRLGIDTHQQAVVYMRQDCPVCRSEGFAAEARVALEAPP